MEEKRTFLFTPDRRVKLQLTFRVKIQTGTITLDPVCNTGACTSGITFLNGENSQVPWVSDWTAWRTPVSWRSVTSWSMENCRMRSNWKILKNITGTRCSMRIYATSPGFSQGAHPMAMLSSVVNVSTFYPDFSAPDQKGVDLAILGWWWMPTIAGWALKNIGQPFVILTIISFTARISWVWCFRSRQWITNRLKKS